MWKPSRKSSNRRLPLGAPVRRGRQRWVAFASLRSRLCCSRRIACCTGRFSSATIHVVGGDVRKSSDKPDRASAAVAWLFHGGEAEWPRAESSCGRPPSSKFEVRRGGPALGTVRRTGRIRRIGGGERVRRARKQKESPMNSDESITPKTTSWFRLPCSNLRFQSRETTGWASVIPRIELAFRIWHSGHSSMDRGTDCVG